jgi:hypothetical protein
MAVLSWGKPKIEIALLGTNDVLGTWTEIDIPQENTTQLEIQEGDEQVAKEEGGKVVDRRRNANSYTLTFSLFAKKGAVKPITDNDGIVNAYYAVRLTPEDPETEGIQMQKCSVSAADSFTTEIGKLWTYTFYGLKPATGNILQPYTAPAA